VKLGSDGGVSALSLTPVECRSVVEQALSSTRIRAAHWLIMKWKERPL